MKNEVRKTEWEKEYNSLINFYHISKLKDIFKDLEKNNYDLNCCLNIKTLSYSEIEWVQKQIDEFKLGILPVYKIEKLKIIGLFEGEERFNEDDLEIIDLFFKNVDTIRFDKDDFLNNNWHLKLAKFFVMNYYHRKKKQKYEISDYINEIIVNALSIVNSNKNINLARLKIQILSRIKIFNKKYLENEEEFLEEKNETYDINNYINNIDETENVKEYLSYLTDREKDAVCYYLGIVIENNNISYSDYHTLKEVGKKINVSRERARQILNKAFRKINLKRKKMNNQHIHYDYSLTKFQRIMITLFNQEDRKAAVKLFSKKKYNADIIRKLRYILIYNDIVKYIKNEFENQWYLYGKEDLKNALQEYYNINEFLEQIEKEHSEKNKSTIFSK